MLIKVKIWVKVYLQKYKLSDAYYQDNFYYEDCYSRPAITLKSGIKISSGNGTISNPYVIE